MNEKRPWYEDIIDQPIDSVRFSRVAEELGLRLKSKQDSDVTKGWFESESRGISIPFTDGKVTSIMLFSDSHPDFDPYGGDLPLGITFDTPADALDQAIGPPFKIGGVGQVRRYVLSDRLILLAEPRPDQSGFILFGLEPLNASSREPTE